MARMTKKAVYDKYYGERRLSNAARVLVDMLAALESRNTMICATEKLCPKCSHFVHELRVEPGFKLTMVFCKHCHFFLVYDRLGRIKTFAEDFPSNAPLYLPPPAYSGKPLARSIFNHLKRIKKESD